MENLPSKAKEIIIRRNNDETMSLVFVVEDTNKEVIIGNLTRLELTLRPNINDFIEQFKAEYK